MPRLAQFEWESKFVNAGLAGQIRIPLEVGSGPLQVRLVSRTVRAFAAYPVRISKATSLSVGAAPGIDWIDVEPKGTDPTAHAQPAFSVADPIVRFFLSFRVRLEDVEVGSASLGASW